MKKNVLIFLGILSTVSPLLFAQTVRPGEAGIVSIWNLHIAESNEHSKVIEACEAFRKAAPADPLAWVADGLGAWRYLKVGATSSAEVVLQRMASALQTDPLGKAAAVMSKRWLTRLDRERVKAALRILYRKNIEFPATLDELKRLHEQFQPPYTDRWGQKWSYRLVEFKHLKGIRGQKYELLSANLGQMSDLETALGVPYVSRMPLKPTRLIGGVEGKESVEFSTTDRKNEKRILTVGGESDGIRFAYKGPTVMVLSDGDHWLVITKGK